MKPRLLAPLAALGALALLTATPLVASAKSPHQVDPLTMTPALNPDFTWSCFEAGTGITCQGTFVQSYGPEVVDFECDGHPVYVTGRGDEQMTRWHTSDGLATKTVVNLDYPGDRFTLNADGSGAVVTVRGHWNRHYVYPTPGDRSTRVLTEVGQPYMAFDDSGHKLFQSTGLVRWLPGADFEGIDVVHGPHFVENDPDGSAFVAAVCGALI